MIYLLDHTGAEFYFFRWISNRGMNVVTLIQQSFNNPANITRSTRDQDWFTFYPFYFRIVFCD